jgi:hypothetical protein
MFSGVRLSIAKEGDCVIIKVVRSVPGTVDTAVLRAGDVADVADGAALSLIADGFAEEVVRETPERAAETAVAAPNRRARNKS